MRIRMITTAAGPKGVLTANKVYNLPTEQAKELVAGKYAIALEKGEKAEVAAIAVPEQAIKKPGRPRKATDAPVSKS